MGTTRITIHVFILILGFFLIEEQFFMLLDSKYIFIASFQAADFYLFHSRKTKCDVCYISEHLTTLTVNYSNYLLLVELSIEMIGIGWYFIFANVVNCKSMLSFYVLITLILSHFGLAPIL